MPTDSCPLSSQPGDTLGDGGSVLDFVSVKPYPDVSLDMTMLGTLGMCPPILAWVVGGVLWNGAPLGTH